MLSETLEPISKVANAKKLSLGLQSDNKKVRKQALIDLQKLLNKPDEYTNQDLRNIFTEIHMYTLNGIRDKTETVREQAIKFTNFLIIDKLPINDYYLTYIFPVIVERIGSVEIVEESEEIRLQLVELLEAIILKYSETEQLKPFLGDCIEILKETVKDKYPIVKELSCKCIQELAQALPKDFHLQSQNLLKPTITCLNHQRNKVRVEAIKAIGVIVMHSPHQALDEAVGPLADRLFDQIPLVRRTVAQVAGKWLEDYRDRYSFWAKILPLLLTGLNDEVDETRKESEQLWEHVGLKYQQENEKDLKDKLDYLLENPKYYPTHWKRPNLGCRWLVQRNIIKLNKAIANELVCWQDDIRLRTAQLLYQLALHAEDGITQNLQDLLTSMYTAARDSDSRVVDHIFYASEVMGLFVPPKSWKLLILPAIENGAHYGHILVLRGFIKGAPKEYICDDLEEITNVISDSTVCFTRKKKMQVELFKCVEAIQEKYNERCGNDTAYNIFKILVSVLALKDQEIDATMININILDDLCKILNLQSQYYLWNLYLSRLLKEIYIDPKAWTVATPERCIFEIILLESGESFGENLKDIGQILAETLNIEADPESKLRTFWALSTSFESKEVIFKRTVDLADFFSKLITEVFIPSLVWKAGMTAEALRTITASCLLCALTPSPNVDLFSDKDELVLLFDKLLPLLLSLMEDASYRSRILAMDCIKCLKLHCYAKQIWDATNLIKVYTEILKRLDDPIDKVRLNALQVLPDILNNCPEDFKELHYRAHHEIIIDTLMCHFDDDDEVVQNLVFEILKVMGEINAKELVDKVKRHKPLVRNQIGCDDILKYMENLQIS